MAPVQVDPSRVHGFVDAVGFERCLAQHYASEPEVWIKLHKVGSGLPSITAKEAIEASLCWGWIDAVRKGASRPSRPLTAVQRGVTGSSPVHRRKPMPASRHA